MYRFPLLGNIKGKINCQVLYRLNQNYCFKADGNKFHFFTSQHPVVQRCVQTKKPTCALFPVAQTRGTMPSNNLFGSTVAFKNSRILTKWNWQLRIQKYLKRKNGSFFENSVKIYDFSYTGNLYWSVFDIFLANRLHNIFTINVTHIKRSIGNRKK